MGLQALSQWAGCGGALCIGAGLLGLVVVCSGSAALGAVNVLERSYNEFRTGANTAETVLTPTNVTSSANQFHKRFEMKVDGKIEGSPLYASGITIAGGTHNVVYVATMHNSVYAFDADTGTQLSVRSLGNPVIGRLQAKLHVPRAHRRAWRFGGDVEQYPVRGAGPREALPRQHRADVPECQWPEGLSLRSGLQLDAGRRKLRADVPKVDWPVLHAGSWEQLSVTPVLIVT